MKIYLLSIYQYHTINQNIYNSALYIDMIYYNNTDMIFFIRFTAFFSKDDSIISLIIYALSRLYSKNSQY